MAYERGNRVIFDTVTGRIVHQFGEITNSTHPIPYEEINGLDYIDLEYALFDKNKFFIERIDLETRQPILQKHPWVEDEPTPEELIAKMEEELALIKAEQELGGIA